ncbi:MAG TPA: FGGY-family carbohydrate kinase [Leptolyngbyaceae cyanobacterium M65_K2018_010]|nr:FGGY-family carbohydrate kinase [Leptolyngbyaceae cyanobacterium M65_K2018_010]
MSPSPLALGIDFGTSGVRGAVVDDHQQLRWFYRQHYPSRSQIHNSWRDALLDLLAAVPEEIGPALTRIAVDGTSGTVLLCDRGGEPLTPALLYNEACPSKPLDPAPALVPPHSPARSATSSLAKLLWWQHTLPKTQWHQATYLLHQADWLAAQIHGQWGISDYHNSLKLGYDPEKLSYPAGLQGQPWTPLLPQVLTPGQGVGPVTQAIAAQFGLSPDCWVMAGTTDSMAAFLASGADQPGDGVTSLGSTLVVKLLSQRRVEATEYGIYSHRLGRWWLPGGASNTGGAVLKHFFDSPTLAQLSQRIDPLGITELDYYPLLKPGERFPIQDPHLAPRLTPRPPQDEAFLHGLLVGIARIEKQGYDLLQQLGSTPLRQIYTAGGGARNPTWHTLREQILQVPIKIAASVEAAVGTAYLAQGVLAARFDSPEVGQPTP